MKQKTKKIFKRNAAFTLVELLVSIGIFTVITSIAVFSHNQFNSSIVLTNLAYEVALSVRQAQVYGLTVKARTIVPSAIFNSGYGIHFYESTDSGNKTMTYRLFEDKAPLESYTSYPNHSYDSGESIETFYLNRGNSIKKICLTNSSGVTCVPGTSAVDITFLRPNPDAVVVNSSICPTSSPCSQADICLGSPDNLYKRIKVESTGQISVVTDDVTVCNN